MHRCPPSCAGSLSNQWAATAQLGRARFRGRAAGRPSPTAGLVVMKRTTPAAGAWISLELVAPEVADATEHARPHAPRRRQTSPRPTSPPAVARARGSCRRCAAADAAAPARPAASPDSGSALRTPSASIWTRALLEQAAAAGLGDRPRGSRRPPPRSTSCRARPSSRRRSRTTYGSPIATAIPCARSSTVRLLVDRERLERLDHVAAVQVEHGVGGRDQRVEDRAREDVACSVPSYEPGKQRFRFLPSSGTTNGERRSERLHAHDRARR